MIAMGSPSLITIGSGGVGVVVTGDSVTGGSVTEGESDVGGGEVVVTAI
jgi:hypothetical protein